MTEHPTSHPSERREYALEDRPLIAAARDLARAVAVLTDPDPERRYGRVPQAVIVGGYVRDSLLGLDPKDADVEVYGVAPERLKELLESMFGKTKDVGEAFGIIKVPIGDGLELDVSIPRRESKAGRGHAGFLVHSDPSLDIKEAARRRDFTVNALAMDPVTDAIFDPFGGLKDIETRTLRVTDAERFQDDPLRVLRAVQFVARLDFSVDPDSERLMRKMVERGDLAELSRERITGEFEKLLFKGRHPSAGLAFARRIGAVEATFPDAEVPDWDAWADLLDRSVSYHEERHAALAAFLSGFSTETRDTALSSLKLNAKDEECAKALLVAASFKDDAPTNPTNDARRMVKRARPATPEAYAAWLRMLGRGKEADRFLKLVQEHQIDAKPLLQGRDLIELFKLKPGSKFREILEAVEAARDRAEIETREQAVELAKTMLPAASSVEL